MYRILFVGMFLFCAACGQQVAESEEAFPFQSWECPGWEMTILVAATAPVTATVAAGGEERSLELLSDATPEDEQLAEIGGLCQNTLESVTLRTDSPTLNVWGYNLNCEENLPLNFTVGDQGFESSPSFSTSEWRKSDVLTVTVPPVTE